MLLSNASYDITERLAGLMKSYADLRLLPITASHRCCALLLTTFSSLCPGASVPHPEAAIAASTIATLPSHLHEADSATGFSIQRSKAKSIEKGRQFKKKTFCQPFTF